MTSTMAKSFPKNLSHLEELIIDGEWQNGIDFSITEIVQSLSNLKCLDLRFRFNEDSSARTEAISHPVNGALMTALTERCVLWGERKANVIRSNDARQ